MNKDSETISTVHHVHWHFVSGFMLYQYVLLNIILSLKEHKRQIHCSNCSNDDYDNDGATASDDDDKDNDDYNDDDNDDDDNDDDNGDVDATCINITHAKHKYGTAIQISYQ